MLRKKEIDWFYEGGAAAIYPDGKFLFPSDYHLLLRFVDISV